MNIKEAIWGRRSIRSYKKKKIDKNTLKKIVEAGTMAPSACNQQRYSLIVIADDIVRNRIMAFPDFETISSKVINILINDKSSISKILLADIYIKGEKYEVAYKLIQENSKNENDKIQFIKNLIRVKEFGIAQKMIDDILNSSQDKIILRKTILKIWP